MIYPVFKPQVKAAPPIAGPTALPTALILTAKPFKVPRTRRLAAEFVSRIREQGKAKIVATDRTNMITSSAIFCFTGSSISAVYGVAKHIIGKAIPQALKQFRTPYFRATGGKIKNCIKQPQMPYIVYMLPILEELKSYPPLNLKGRDVLAGVCI